MKRWPRRVLILLFVLAWLGVLLLPTLAVVLARNGQIQLGDSDGRHNGQAQRLLMVERMRATLSTFERMLDVEASEVYQEHHNMPEEKLEGESSPMR